MIKRMFLVMCILMLALPALAYEVDLPVPLYGAESSIYGGAAVAQMILDSYPPPGTPIYIPQSTIWTAIQTYNSGEPGWATDPVGMRDTLMALNPPPAGIWVIKSYDIKEDLMFQITFWMNFNSYAVATLVNSGYHWVVVAGYITDIEPTGGSGAVLQEITIHNPYPIGSGQVETMTAAVWYTTYWDNPVAQTGTWYDKYVAVIEPPVTEGTVSFVNEQREGIVEITGQEALQFAETWIATKNLAAKDASYADLNNNQKQNYGPLLVREGFSYGKTERDVPYYYIVPYYVSTNAAKLSTDSIVNGVSVCVIVNAFTGAFEEVASFNTPIKYIYKDEALEIAAKALEVETKELSATLIYKAGILSQSRVCPVWEVMGKAGTVFVDQLGKVKKSAAVLQYGR